MLLKLNEFQNKEEKINGKINLTNNEKISDILDNTSGSLDYEIYFKKSIKQNIYLLVLHIYGKIYTLCQICIDKLEYNVNEIIEIPILNSESELNDAIESRDNNYDAFVINQEIDVDEFVTDEIIVLLPIAFKHDIC
jgi:uncharacterized metal-binding protein YceD (DUF177 family)